MAAVRACLAALATLAVLAAGARPRSDQNERVLNRRAATFLAELEPVARQRCNSQVNKEWNFATNLTDHNQKIMTEGRLAEAKWKKETWEKVIQWDWQKITDQATYRQFKILSKLGPAALPEDKLARYNDLQSEMQKLYSSAKICSFDDPAKCDLSLEPELTEILAKSRRPDELEHVWLKWREASGKKMRKQYTEFVQLIDDVAKATNFTSGTELWLDGYESPDFREQVASLWEQMTSLYRQLHAFVRGRLRGLYGPEVVSRNGPIPAHLLGNMWAQSWTNLIDICKPFPDKLDVDVTEQMKRKGFTPRKMFRLSDEFFTSLGLVPMTEEFWNRSMLEKPADGRSVVCHASAWDFCNGRDTRIKQCTEITMEHLITAHHEMGHIQYYLQYSHQPSPFRRGANSGFHEAVGDTLALSVQTPKHLKEVGLLDQEVQDPQVDLNFLMSTALKKVAFLPFGYLIDRWRWGIFSGNISHDDLNCEWWKLRENVQGVKPPQVRSEMDFDPGAKYHVASNTPYIRYFVAGVLQFQFHKALCQAADQYEPADPSRPLHGCDIYRSKVAGKILADMLKLGRSLPWPDALQVITGQRRMDASALLEYFTPLHAWLQEENARTGETIGWQSDYPSCKKANEAGRK